MSGDHQLKELESLNCALKLLISNYPGLSPRELTYYWKKSFNNDLRPENYGCRDSLQLLVMLKETFGNIVIQQDSAGTQTVTVKVSYSSSYFIFYNLTFCIAIK